MPHKLRKTRKKRASRLHGYGQVGQHRGSGVKGRRKSGYNKHGWTYVVKYEPDYYGKKGFTSPRSLGQRVNILNVGELEELAAKLAVEQRLEKRGRRAFLDLDKLGYEKLLGKGRITKPLLVKVTSHSKAAAKKIEEAGGRILEDTGKLKS
jgi:large subunit ribosomal protein L15